jgi:hypothetical protein
MIIHSQYDAIPSGVFHRKNDARIPILAVLAIAVMALATAER